MKFESNSSKEGLTPEERRKIMAPWRGAETPSIGREERLSDESGEVWWTEDAQPQRDMIAAFIQTHKSPKLGQMTLTELKQFEHAAIVARNQAEKLIAAARAEQEDAALLEELDQARTPGEAGTILRAYPKVVFRNELAKDGIMDQKEMIEALNEGEYETLPPLIRKHLHFLDFLDKDLQG